MERRVTGTRKSGHNIVQEKTEGQKRVDFRVTGIRKMRVTGTRKMSGIKSHMHKKNRAQ